MPARRSARGPAIVQRGASSTARRRMSTLGSRDLARPASGGGGIAFALLLVVLAAIALLAAAGTGHL